MKRLFMTLAAMLLVSVGAFAQSNEPLKGDVNGDGVVDVADIAAVIAIIKNNASQETYYWYVGQTDPSTMTSITPVVNDASSPGWRLIGSSIGTYTFSSPLHNSETNPIVSSPSAYTNWYVAVPSNSTLGIYDSDDVNEVTEGNWTTESNIILENVTYNVYKSIAEFRKFNGFWVH